MNSREGPRNVTLSEQLTMETDIDSPKVRTIPPGNGTGEWDGSSGQATSSRTLFDIIQQDNNWKPVKDRLRLQRVGAAFSEGVPSPDSLDRAPSLTSSGRAPTAYSYDRAPPSMGFARAPSLRRNATLARGMTRSVSVAPSSVLNAGIAPGVGEIVITDVTDVPDEDELAKEDSGQGGISLMSLLEQTDTNWGDDGPDEADDMNYQDDGDDDEEEDGASGKKIYHVCCVCMVRHKGAAFIPCGHTFCRLCSRELWVSRGNCPLCNGFIQEILDIF